MTDRGTPPDYPEGVATCDNCGWVEHTPEQLAECLDSMLAPVCCEEDDIDEDDEGNPIILDDEPAEFQTMPSGKIIRVRGH